MGYNSKNIRTAVKRLKCRSRPKLSEKITFFRDKLLKKLRKSKLHIDKEIYKIGRYEVEKLISYKKKKGF